MEQKDAGVNSCHSEYADMRADALRAGVGNQ
jgi:hypothetical protein